MNGVTTAKRRPRDVGGWVALWRNAEIPVLHETAAQIEALRQREDEVNAHLLAPVISGDPLMCLKLLAHVARDRSWRRVTDTETTTAALVMLGISPFFHDFGPQSSIEDHLAEHPHALAGLMRLLVRSQRAARYALGFAVHRMDRDAEVIHEAALLHDFAEMLLWCHAPELAMDIDQRQRADPALRSAAVQRQVLGVELVDVQQALMRAWRLRSCWCASVMIITTTHPRSETCCSRSDWRGTHQAGLGQRGHTRRRARHLTVAQPQAGGNTAAAARSRQLRPSATGHCLRCGSVGARPRRWDHGTPGAREQRLARGD